jgi:hypothetical protein
MSGIIVRDDAARESFKTEIGRVGLMLYVKSFSVASVTKLLLGRYSIAKVLNTMM